MTPFAASHYSRRSGTLATHHGSHSQDGNLELPHVHEPRGYPSERNPWERTLGQPRDDSLSPEDARSSHRPSVIPLPLPPAGTSPVPSIHIVDDEEGDMRSPGTSHASFAEDALPRSPPSKRERVRLAFTRTMRVLFPTLVYFTDKGFVGMVVALFAAPAVLALTVTLPVVYTPQGDAKALEKRTEASGSPLDGRAAEERLVDYEDEGAEWTLVAEDIVEEEMHELGFNKWLMATQCVLGPLFCATVLLGDMKQFPLYATVIGIAGAITAMLVLILADDGSDPAACVARCSMGFFVAIVWIMAIADEVVQVLQVRDNIRFFRNCSRLIGLCRPSA
jgi:sodium/potassium/calcium exchanger 6